MNTVIKTKKYYLELWRSSNNNALVYGYVNMIDKHSWSLFHINIQGLYMSEYLSSSGMETNRKTQLKIIGVDLL